MSKLQIHEHQGFWVVRGDLIHGGIKFLCLNEIFPEIDQSEIVYAGHQYGHAGLALGLAGLYHHKRVTLFFAGEPVEVPVFIETKNLKNVTCIFESNVTHQSKLLSIAKKYADEKNAYLIPLGFDFPAFNSSLIRLARSFNVYPREVWVAGGSGTTSRCLAQVWPEAFLHTVNLGMMPCADMGTENEYFVPEEPSQMAELSPPYPSSLYYDSKIWRFVREHANPGALIWNIA